MLPGYGESETPSGPLNGRTLGLALAFHAAVFLAFWLVGWVLFPVPDVLVPIDMTIVPPWAEQDPNDPNPDPNPPPEPTLEKPTPKPEPEPDPPKIEAHEDAVERIVEKPKKKEFKKGELKKPDEKKKDEKPQKKEFVRTGKLIRNPPPVRLPPGKGTSRDKPLSMAEIQKALAAGARFGASNQLAASEEQRCVSLISRRFYEVWDVPGGFEGHSVLLTIRISAGGRISGFSIAKSSGIAALDASVLDAARRAHHVNGLSADFISRFPELTIEMKPKAQ